MGWSQDFKHTSTRTDLQVLRRPRGQMLPGVVNGFYFLLLAH